MHRHLCDRVAAVSAWMIQYRISASINCFVSALEPSLTVISHSRTSLFVRNTFELSTLPVSSSTDIVIIRKQSKRDTVIRKRQSLRLEPLPRGYHRRALVMALFIANLLTFQLVETVTYKQPFSERLIRRSESSSSLSCSFPSYAAEIRLLSSIQRYPR